MAVRRTRTLVPASVWPAASLVILGAFAALTSSATLPVTGPLAVAMLVTTAFYWALWSRRRHAIPWFELGAVYVTAVALYTFYPLIGYLVLGGAYTPTNDNRLWAAPPTAGEMGHVAWLYVAHLAAFGAVYLGVRGRLPLRMAELRRPRWSILVSAAALYLLIEAFSIFLGLFYDMSAGDYLQTYLFARRLPLLLAQLFGHLNGVKYALAVLLLGVLFSRYQRTRFLIAGWIGATALITAGRLQSRTELVLLLLAATMMYHVIVRPLSVRFMVMTAAAGLAGFILLGVYRYGAAAPSGFSLFNPFVYGSEFELLFGNAIDLTRLLNTGALQNLPPGFHLADLTALIPQQIAPFPKVDPAEWYVSTFYPVYAAAGGGLAFGATAEAVLTGGWISAAARGAALGFCFAYIHRFYVRHAGSYWVLALYVWTATLCYQSFRNRTFFLLLLFVYRFLPAVVGVRVLASALSRAARQVSLSLPRRPARASLS